MEEGNVGDGAGQRIRKRSVGSDLVIQVIG
jgi:hypothetical protein